MCGKTINMRKNYQNIKLLALIVGCGLIISSCKSTWMTVNQKTQHVKLSRIELDLPSGWMIYSDHFNQYSVARIGVKDRNVERVMITKNGFLLDVIDIVEFKLRDAFPSVGVSAEKAMLPFELSELWLAELKIRSNRDRLEILSNEPVRLAGQDGFKLQYSVTDSKGLVLNNLHYGFIVNDRFYSVSYQAPSEHFYNAGLADANKLIQSIKSLNTR